MFFPIVGIIFEVLNGLLRQIYLVVNNNRGFLTPVTQALLVCCKMGSTCSTRLRRTKTPPPPPLPSETLSLIAPPSTPFPFLSLPRELRDMIYQHVFRSPTGYVFAVGLIQGDVKHITSFMFRYSLSARTTLFFRLSGHLRSTSDSPFSLSAHRYTLRRCRIFIGRIRLPCLV